jgi:hypothetical protein
MESLTQFQVILQGGAFGLLAFIVVYGAKSVVPRFLDSYAQLNATLEAQRKVIARLSAIILLHDATVRGQNPDTLGTTEELMNRILNGGKNTP